MKNKIMWIAEGVLLVITAIWGSSFVAANIALDIGLSPLYILMCRFFISTILMVAVYNKRLLNNFNPKQIKYGVILGTIFLAAFYMQMLGLKYSTPSNNAIITSLNVVLVPLVWWLASKRKPSAITFFSCAISLIGVAIVSINISSGFSINIGDIFSLLSAILYAGQIVAVGEMPKRNVDYVTLVFTQFLVASILAMFLFFIVEKNTQSFANVTGWVTIIYLGIICTCICFFFQAWALRKIESTRGAVIMSLEAFFGSMFSILMGMDILSWRILVGGGLLFLAVLLPEIIKK